MLHPQCHVYLWWSESLIAFSSLGVWSLEGERCTTGLVFQVFSTHILYSFFLLSGHPFGPWSCLTSSKELKVEFFSLLNLFEPINGFCNRFPLNTTLFLPHNVFSCPTRTSASFLAIFYELYSLNFYFTRRGQPKTERSIPKSKTSFKSCSFMHLFVLLFFWF